MREKQRRDGQTPTSPTISPGGAPGLEYARTYSHRRVNDGHSRGPAFPKGAGFLMGNKGMSGESGFRALVGET